MRVLAISGSLRADSMNTRLIHALPMLAPDDIQIDVYEDMGLLPHFNPDDDWDTPPDSVIRFRERIRACGALIICAPEYAHGVPGTLKNALDWTVGSGDLDGKPVAAINASPHSTYGHAHLVDTLKMLGRFNEAASAVVPLAGKKLSTAEISNHPEIAPLLIQALHTLKETVAI